MEKNQWEGIKYPPATSPGKTRFYSYCIDCCFFCLIKDYKQNNIDWFEIIKYTPIYIEVEVEIGTMIDRFESEKTNQ